MHSSLDREHTELLLKTRQIGRLACAAGGRPYIVPITYVYENGCIYGHTNDGAKVALMRENPSVCIEVDHVDDFRNWQSAVCSGRFEELEGAEMVEALDMLLSRLMRQGRGAGSTIEEAEYGIRLRPTKGVTYRIRIDEMSGRYEHAKDRLVT